MSVHATKARLAGMTRQLALEWEHVRTTWTDDKAREFHQRYIVQLIADVEKAVAAMEQLEKLMIRVKEDCE